MFLHDQCEFCGSRSLPTFRVNEVRFSVLTGYSFDVCSACLESGFLPLLPADPLCSVSDSNPDGDLAPFRLLPLSVDL